MVLFGGCNPKNMQVTKGGCAGHFNGDRLAELVRHGVDVVTIRSNREDGPAGTAPEWIAIRPGSDTAMLLALVHTLVASGLHDTGFLARYCTGFERVRAYVMGETDGQPKDADWAASLDADQYYWSSQNPYTNAASFSQIAKLASMVRSSPANPDGSPKRWFAPFAPGFNTKLIGGSTCVPRNSLQTMQKLLAGNKASNPDAWVFISWNEIAEGTYVLPLQRYGRTYLDGLRALLTA